MEPLLKITTIPIRYELKIQNAKLEYSNSTADLEISRGKGGMRIKSKPIQLHIDSSQTYESIRPNSMKTVVGQAAQKGNHAAYDATATLAKEGHLFLNAKIGEDAIGQVIAQRSTPPTKEFGLGFTPSVRPELQWSEPDLTIEYEMDKLNFDLKVANGNFEFIPGDIEISITQFPGVKIEYIGQPLYIPPRDDAPSVDVKA